MAGSQLHCLDSTEPYTPLTERNPDFYYSEGQRLALEALLVQGEAAFQDRLTQEKLRPFLSEGEIQKLRKEEEVVPPAGGAEDCGRDEESSLSYWPGCSEEPTPELDLGWPDSGAWKGITRAEIYTHPPGDGAPHLKALVRRDIQHASKVIAIVMDVFTDPDILMDLYDAAVRHRVPVYLILSQENLKPFLTMAEKCCLNIRYTENLRVRIIRGCTFQSRDHKKVIGTLKEKFLLVDGESVVTGSYSFTWTDARLNRHLVTRLTGEVTEVFDREFRTLFAASSPLPQASNGPSVTPFISVLEGVHLSNRIAERRSVAPQPVARSRAGDWDLVALSDVLRNVQRSRLSVAKTTGARASKSLWDLSQLSQMSGSSAGSGTEMGEESKKWGYQDTPAMALMRQRGAGQPSDEPRITVYMAPGYRPPAVGYRSLGRLQGQLLHPPAGVGLPRPWEHPMKPLYGRQPRY
uniref:Family with sequence similarity 83 member E n=1 Tax=Sphenodon punctatus TaxID=8508 RepID=A0A8D0HAD0_SPHPU